MNETPVAAPSSSALARWITRVVLRSPGGVLLGGVVIMLVSTLLAARLSLQKDLAELLPPQAPSVIALKKLNQRVGGTGNVAIALEGEPQALRAYIPVLVETLRVRLGRDLLVIKYQKKDVTDFFSRFVAYYVPLEDLERWQMELAERIARTVNPLLVDLDEPSAGTAGGAGAAGAAGADGAGGQKSGATKADARTLIEEVRAAKAKAQPRNEADPETGYLMSEGGHLAVIFVRPAANSLNLAGSEGMLRRIQGIVEETRPGERGVRISGYTGSIPSALAEVQAIARDIVGTMMLVVALVGVSVVLYFRGVRDLALVAVTLGAASLAALVVWLGGGGTEVTAGWLRGIEHLLATATAPLAPVLSLEKLTPLYAFLMVSGVGAAVLFFRGGRELFLISGAVVVGVLAAMGFAKVWIGHVNAQTAFLGSVIVGTGINYGIIFLDRYGQLRGEAAIRAPGRAQPLDEFARDLERACDETLQATWIAALSTAVSFGVLAAGEVESFRQFGWIGGFGILSCWVATFTLVPASVVLIDRHKPPVPLPAQQPLGWVFRGVGWMCERAPWVLVVVTAGLTVYSGVVAVRARNEVVETDMRRLGTRSTNQKGGIEKLDNRLRKMDDRSSTPAVIATDSREETQAVCEVLRRRASTDLQGILTRCHSINDLLPRDLERRRVVMAKLRADIDKVPRDELAPADRKELDELVRALEERPPMDEDLPHTLKEYFVERDGSVGKLAFVDPRNPHIEENLYKFSDAIRSIPLPSGKVIESSGETVVFADVLRAMRRDVRKLTTVAAVLVLLVLAVVVRRWDTFLRVGGALCIGVVLMCGWAVWMGERLNFFNFVALPTTFGIGIDYAINLEERLRRRCEGGRMGVAAAVEEVGPAVTLAALTSIFGYGSLLTADSRILSSFGRLAILGEVTCVLVAVVLVPALWRLRARKVDGAPPQSTT